MKTSFETRVSRMGLGSFVDINIFCCEISFYLFSSYSPLFKSFKSKSTIMLRPHKGNSRVSFNDTLLNFGLRAQNLRQGIVMKTSFKTRVLRMGLGSFVDINIFVMNYYIIQFLHICSFFSNPLNQNLLKC